LAPFSPETALPGLYVHVPFCASICPYCDFAVKKGDGEKGRRYVDALLDEADGLRSGRLLPEAPALAEAMGALAAARFDTVYLGGGTPSLLPVDALERLLDGLGEHFDLAPDARLFLEANPEDADPTRLEAWKRLGVRTLSFGVQSLDDDDLRFLGRHHSADDAIRTVRQARDVGFDTVSVDLIYGLPDQAPDRWRRQLDRALDLDGNPGEGLGADHLSLYELEIHPRTVFGKRHARGELRPLDEESRAELFALTHRHLEAAGWDVYEVSNFARTSEHRSRHNRKYWHHVPYLGLGPSAHSLARGEGPTLWRSWNERAEPRWRRLLTEGTSPAAGWEHLPPSALALEAMMLGLRHAGGVDLDRIRRLSGLDLERLNRAHFERWIEAGWVIRRGNHLLPTTPGMALADRLASEIETA
jgi:oxygen-independent coproporphyrinogen-3 oxidase